MDFEEIIKHLYAVNELKGYTETEIAPVKAYFGTLPRVVEKFWCRAGRTEAIYPVQDTWIKPEDFVLWITEEELETIRSGLEKKLFELHGWLDMNMSFYSNASNNMVVIMDCGELQIIYGASSEAAYQKRLEVMEGLGES